MLLGLLKYVDEWFVLDPPKVVHFWRIQYASDNICGEIEQHSCMVLSIYSLNAKDLLFICAARTLKTCQLVHAISSKSSAFFGGSNTNVTKFLESRLCSSGACWILQSIVFLEDPT